MLVLVPLDSEHVSTLEAGLSVTGKLVALLWLWRWDH